MIIKTRASVSPHEPRHKAIVWVQNAGVSRSKRLTLDQKPIQLSLHLIGSVSQRFSLRKKETVSDALFFDWWNCEPLSSKRIPAGVEKAASIAMDGIEVASGVI